MTEMASGFEEGGNRGMGTVVWGGGDVISTDTFFLNDVVHGPMTFDSLIKDIVDTRQFQRLRCIKQLGGSYYVYPAADHSRFVHSLGVAHLCHKLCEGLRKPGQPFAHLVSEIDALCVTIAGLIHDLGHGPFSHLWENFLTRQSPDEKWAHEDQSFLMFEALIEENGLWPKFAARGFTERDFVFIKELIHPPKAVSEAYPFKGRDPGKEFLYQIVSNPFSGIDVDKMDYIARDSKALGVDVTFDFRRYLEFVRILRMDDEFWKVGEGVQVKHVNKMVIGVRDKEKHNMVSLFRTRQDLHRKAYQHKTTKIIEKMLLDVFAAVDDEDILPIPSPKTGVNLRLSTAHTDTDAYIHLTNDLQGRIRTILPSPGLSAEKLERLHHAQSLLDKLDRRDVPKVAYEIKFNPTLNENWLKLEEDKWKEDLLKHHSSDGTDVELGPDDIDFVLTNFDYGAKGNDPIANVRFYRKDGSTMKTTLREMRAINDVLPLDICQQVIFIYTRRSEVKDAIRLAAQRWENQQKVLWETPKRARTEFSSLSLRNAISSHLVPSRIMTPSVVDNLPSPVPSNDDDEEDFQPIQDQSPPSFEDRPVTPPLSQPTPTTTRAKPGCGGSGGTKRNLLPELENENL